MKNLLKKIKIMYANNFNKSEGMTAETQTGIR